MADNNDRKMKRGSLSETDLKQLPSMVDRARSGNSDAFSKLYNAYYQRAYFTAFKILRNESAAEDVAQDSFLRLFTKLDTLRESERFENWFFSIVYRRSFDWLRKNSPAELIDSLDTFQENDDRMPACANTELLPFESLEAKENRAHLLRLVNGLTDTQKITVFLHYYQGLSVAEVAETLDSSVATIHKRLYDARASLRASVAQTATASSHIRY
ncbi:MAG: sigma-70 family RNA polymerase sigma factor [Coriobacteriia bacterium]|nr:sigma-70 family RNA polymerase sigma factor [Coriobacteriia bacterium]